jgi:pyridoxamine 5'-phosphate oxidase
MRCAVKAGVVPMRGIVPEIAQVALSAARLHSHKRWCARYPELTLSAKQTPIGYTPKTLSARIIIVTSLADLRQTYARDSLSEADVEPDPIRQFEKWFAEAQAAGVPEPNAMSLATVDAQGRPSNRIVLIKGADARGFVFFTSYESAKGRDLAQNPFASLLFFWTELERQIRIEGRVEKTSAEESDQYFHSRPLGSRIGAWASIQSSVTDRAALEAREARFAAQYGDHPPRPPQWGGYRLVPDAIEFWQGRPSRLHDRIKFSRSTGGSWQIVRLSP